MASGLYRAFIIFGRSTRRVIAKFRTVASGFFFIDFNTTYLLINQFFILADVTDYTHHSRAGIGLVVRAFKLIKSLFHIPLSPIFNGTSFSRRFREKDGGKKLINFRSTGHQPSGSAHIHNDHKQANKTDGITSELSRFYDPNRNVHATSLSARRLSAKRTAECRRCILYYIRIISRITMYFIIIRALQTTFEIRRNFSKLQ